MFGQIIFLWAIQLGVNGGFYRIAPSDGGPYLLATFSGPPSFAVGDYVYFDTDPQTGAAINIEPATALPIIVKRRVTGWTYEKTADVDPKIVANLPNVLAQVR